MDMVDRRDENRLTMTVRRCYPVLLAALALAISGCATTVGLGLGLSYLEQGDEASAAEHLRAFRGLTHSARVAGQVDDALQLMRTEHPLSPQSRHFIATSLESATKSAQELHDARWAYAPWPYYDDYDPFFWGLR